MFLLPASQEGLCSLESVAITFLQVCTEAGHLLSFFLFVFLWCTPLNSAEALPATVVVCGIQSTNTAPSKSQNTKATISLPPTDGCVQSFLWFREPLSFPCMDYVLFQDCNDGSTSDHLLWFLREVFLDPLHKAQNSPRKTEPCHCFCSGDRILWIQTEPTFNMPRPSQRTAKTGGFDIMHSGIIADKFKCLSCMSSLQFSGKFPE